MVAVGVVWKGNKILISKRKENGLLGGLWEFPGGKIQNGEDAKKCVIRKVNEKLGVRVRPVRLIKQIKQNSTKQSKKSFYKSKNNKVLNIPQQKKAKIEEKRREI